jgi:hypothetical protein
MKNINNAEKLKDKLLLKDDRMTIYMLVKKLTTKSKASPTSVLCARIALMVCSRNFHLEFVFIISTCQRCVFLQYPGDKFWDQVDSKLKELRKVAAEGAKDAAQRQRRYGRCVIVS